MEEGNSPRGGKPDYSSRNVADSILYIVDKIVINFPEQPIPLWSLPWDKKKFEFNDTLIWKDQRNEIERLLFQKFKYLESVSTGKEQLSKVGEEAQKAGGHFAYAARQGELALQEQEAKSLANEKLRLDFNNALNQFKDYPMLRKRAKRAYRISIIALVLTGITLSLALWKWLIYKR